jgi:hypothetical protein
VSTPSSRIERIRANRVLPPSRTPFAITRSRPIGVTCLGLLALLTGCGSSTNGVASKSAPEILAATRAAAQSASSVHVTSSAAVGGSKFTLVASLAKNQGQARLSVLGIGLQAIRSGGMLYVKGDRAFDARLESSMGVKVPPGVWLRGPATGALGRVGAFTDMKREVPLILSGGGPVTKGATVNVGGQPTITLKETRKLYTGTLYVATTGRPYPLRLTKTGRETGQTTFTGWNDPVSVSPPASSVDISQLEHLKGR